MRLYECKNCTITSEANKQFKMLAHFLDRLEQADPKSYCVTRWCWLEGKDYGADDYNGDQNYRNGIFKIELLNQQSGNVEVQSVEVCRNDEKSIKEFLTAQLNKFLKCWEPVSGNIQAA